MRNRFLLLLLAFLPFIMNGQNFQPLNPGFEQWDNTAIDAEPTHWNSFATSDGNFAGMASSPHHYHRNGGRPGSAGSSYLTIYTKSILGVKANGNMTIGRIHAGSMTPTSESNYNYTQRGNSDFSQAFTATPDSLYVWVRYNAANSASKGSITCVVHGNNDFKDPNDINTPGCYAGKAVIRMGNTSGWTQMRVPFEYSGTAAPAYLLISMSSHMTQGGGDAWDSLSVDDFELIYSAWLTRLAVNGTEVEGFEKGRLDYTMHLDSMRYARWLDIEAVPEVADTRVSTERIDIDDTTVQYRIYVVGEDNLTSHTYTITVETDVPASPEDLAVETIPQSRFRIYPNPASTKVNLEGENMKNAKLVDMKGCVIRNVDIHEESGKAVLDLSGVEKGIYLIWVDGTAQKIVVE